MNSEIVIYTNHNCCAKTNRGSDCKNKRLKNEYYCHKHKKDFCSRLEKPEECFICTDALGDKDNLLSCGHWMHRSCFLKTNKDTCPICRKKVKLSKEERKNITRETQRDDYEEQMLRDFLVSLIEEMNNPSSDISVSFPMEDFELVELIHNIMTS